MTGPQARRRLYLMRHGSVDYFQPDGTPVPVDDVPLNRRGEDEARAAGELLKACGVQPDRVMTSGLPRTVQTAQHVLAAAGLPCALETDTALQEIRPGRLRDIPPDELRRAFLGTFQSRDDEVEADLVGLELAARGGYNPDASVSLWNKMAKASGGRTDGLAFLSTHPTGPDRIKRLEENVPRVRGLYEQARRG